VSSPVTVQKIAGGSVLTSSTVSRKNGKGGIIAVHDAISVLMYVAAESAWHTTFLLYSQRATNDNTDVQVPPATVDPAHKDSINLAIALYVGERNKALIRGKDNKLAVSKMFHPDGVVYDYNGAARAGNDAASLADKIAEDDASRQSEIGSFTVQFSAKTFANVLVVGDVVYVRATCSGTYIGGATAEKLDKAIDSDALFMVTTNTGGETTATAVAFSIGTTTKPSDGSGSSSSSKDDDGDSTVAIIVSVLVATFIIIGIIVVVVVSKTRQQRKMEQATAGRMNYIGDGAVDVPRNVENPMYDEGTGGGDADDGTITIVRRESTTDGDNSGYMDVAAAPRTDLGLQDGDDL